MRNTKALMTIMSIAMMCEMGNQMYNEDEPRTRTPREPKKKCFRDGCEKPRNGNKLYCSAECCLKHKEEL